LTKNQASNQLDSTSAEVTEEANAQSETQSEIAARRNSQTPQYSRGVGIKV
jgi:hypothetical protein